MPLTTTQQVRLEIGDTDAVLPILSDDEYAYFLSKHDNSVRRASIDAAKSIMLKLATRTDETVDIFTIRGSKAAQSYMMALQSYLKNPDMNPMLQFAVPYAGGISVSDMTNNDNTEDNNIIKNPASDPRTSPDSFFEV